MQPSPSPRAASRRRLSASCDGFDFTPTSSSRKPRRTWDYIPEPEDSTARKLLRDVPDLSEDEAENDVPQPAPRRISTASSVASSMDSWPAKRCPDPAADDGKKDSKNSAVKALRRSTVAVGTRTRSSASRIASSPVVASPAPALSAVRLSSAQKHLQSTPQKTPGAAKDDTRDQGPSASKASPAIRSKPSQSQSQSQSQPPASLDLDAVVQRLRQSAAEGRAASPSMLKELPEELRAGAVQVGQMRAAAAEAAVKALESYMAADKVLSALKGLKATASAASGGQAATALDSFLSQHNALMVATRELAVADPAMFGCGNGEQQQQLPTELRGEGEGVGGVNGNHIEAPTITIPDSNGDVMSFCLEDGPQPSPSPPSTPRQSPHRASPLPPRNPLKSDGPSRSRPPLGARDAPRPPLSSESGMSSYHSDSHSSTPRPAPSAVSATVVQAVEKWFLKLVENDLCSGKGVKTREDAVGLMGALSRAQDWVDTQLAPAPSISGTSATNGSSTNGTNGTPAGKVAGQEGAAGVGAGVGVSVHRRRSVDTNRLAKAKGQLEDALMRWAVQRYQLPAS